MQQAPEEPINEERSPWPAKSMFLPLYIPSGHWNRGGTREKGGWVLMQQKCPVSGEVDRPGKYLKTEQRALPQGSHPWAGSMISVL